MTGKEMGIAVGVELRKLNTTATKSFLTEEVEYYLNKAQKRFIASKVRKREGVFQYDIVDAESIDKLIKSEEVSLIGTTVTLPRDLDFFIRGSVKSDCGLIPLNLVKAFGVDQIEQTPFYKSSRRKWNTELVNNSLVVYPHKNTVGVSSALITYVRKPTDISISLNVGCELRDTFHDNIVELAVALMKVDNVSQDAQLKDQEIKTNSVKLG